MQIGMICSDELPQVVELFCTCFCEDHYYAKLFPDLTTRRKEMGNAFAPDILYCIQQQTCFGVYQGNDMIAFILSFDYGVTKKTNETVFKRVFSYDNSLYNERLHTMVDSLEGQTIFCLSIAVNPAYRSQGIASSLLDYVMEKYSTSNFVADVSNTKSLNMYVKRNFTIEELAENYHLAIHHRRASTNTFEFSENISVLVPNVCDLQTHHIQYELLKGSVAVCGYKICDQNQIHYFTRNDTSVDFGCLVRMDYHNYLLYQRALNVSVCEESMRGEFLFLANNRANTINSIMNPVLEDMITCRKSEWSIVPDVFVSIPVQYDKPERIFNADTDKDEHAEQLIKMLDFRTHYELGVRSENDSVDDFANCKNRIKRKYLGKIKVQIFTEPTLDHYDDIGDPIGGARDVDLFISLDVDSNCAVLSWYSLSTPFLISHYLDNIMRNQLRVVTEQGTINIYDYVNTQYGIVKKGMPKMFVVIPDEKRVLAPNQIASLLAAETIYPEGENFGGIIDSEILDIVHSEYGMGQYDRAYVYAYRNVVIQFAPDLKGSLQERLNEESITQFYIELILFHEAAINIANRAIAELFTTDQIKRPEDFLHKVDLIHDHYAQTIDFWDITVNYPTSQKSIEMLREAFRIQETLQKMVRNQEYLDMVFDTKCDLTDRKDSKRMDRSLAIISILAIFSAWVDSYAFVETWSDLLSESSILLLQRILFVFVSIVAGYAILHLVKGRFDTPLSKKNKKNKKNTKSS